MTIGPTLILRLPNSRKLVKVSTTESGNSLGGRFWSDGKGEGPMLPDHLLLMVHPRDGQCFWLDDCREVDREYPWQPLRKYMRIPEAVEPDLHDYRRLLDSGWRFDPVPPDDWFSLVMRFFRTRVLRLFSRFGHSRPAARKAPEISRRRYLLTRFWWKANDPIRHSRRGASLPPDFRDKLLELEKTLDLTDPDDRITAAEIARECGDFGQALKLLEAPISENFADYQRLIRIWSNEGDRLVREIPATR